MWFTEEALKDINELLFFANTPGYIVNGLRKKNILILKLSYNNKDEIISEINEHMQCISTTVYNFSYVYILIIYLETSFPKPYIENFDYKAFTFLEDVIKIMNSGSKEIYRVVNIQNEPPKVTLYTGGM